jgi:ribosomal protein S12 methylthiotransferase accessory factor
MGITRLGNITGLDRIGIPVVTAVRPNSRSVSVSQGKGLDLTQATASALMEAIEGFHAEEVAEGPRASYRELAAEAAVVDPLTLCSTGRPFDADAEICWLEGYDLLRQEPCWVPAELVHTDYTQPLDGSFLAGSNGLASGNHPVEAIGSAICELVERDAVAVWSASGIRARGEISRHRLGRRRRLPDLAGEVRRGRDGGPAVERYDGDRHPGLRLRYP